MVWKDDGSLPQAKVDLKGDGVKAVQLVQGTLLPLEFETLTLNAALKNGKADLNWLFKIANNGQLKAMFILLIWKRDGSFQVMSKSMRLP